MSILWRTAFCIIATTTQVSGTDDGEKDRAGCATYLLSLGEFHCVGVVIDRLGQGSVGRGEKAPAHVPAYELGLVECAVGVGGRPHGRSILEFDVLLEDRRRRLYT